jgi:hypothetical protein
VELVDDRVFVPEGIVRQELSDATIREEFRSDAIPGVI